MIESDGEFIPPPEAPVFEPTREEFQDPLAYIAKIRPIAEKSGICKVRPPAEWQPPFAVDVDTFRFTPRVQRLNELEAKTRVKLNFLDKLAKFWELQGTPLRIPFVERKYLNLHNLQKIVSEEGGFDHVCRDRKWSRVTVRMGYPPSKGIGSSLRTHYEKLLYPFDVFNMGALIDQEKRKKLRAKKLKEELEMELKREVKLENGIKKEPETGMRRSRRILKDDMKPDPSLNKELQRLQFYGAGPKAAIADDLVEEISSSEGIKSVKTTKKSKCKKEETELDINGKKKKKMKTRDKRPVSYIDQYMCAVCGKGDSEEYMLLCDGCDDAFHTFCLIPPINDVPKGDWRCPKCVAKECNRPKEAYGFEQAKKEYSLQSFGEMADQFKLDYFNMPVHMVPCSTVEKEFWRLVNCIEEDVIVEYGADIHAAEMGSGFPTESNCYVFGNEDVSEYINAGWNLNNLPVLEKSVLAHINADISGMKIPWCYVGMCFSSFCWHIEDHWTYSINYMHWGEPKTWYGVPGHKAELLEECMKKNAPELFEQSPDLLHQLTTIMNPNILQAYGVPIVRTNQHAGEFVITFPRSYHAGFNQGYNFAEAVNFATADWMKMGRNCIDHYQSINRQCVFSHEELVCKMAANPEQLDLSMAAAVHGDMLVMVENEKKHRKKLLDLGMTEAEREAFELLPDDERQCDFCKTTCFLAALTCVCSPNKLVCLKHIEKLCRCPPSSHCLRYSGGSMTRQMRVPRYTLDELPAMLHRLKVRAESFDNWACKVKTALEAPQNQKLDMGDLKELVLEAAEKKFPDSPLLQSLEEAISEAEKCASVASQLVSKKMRTRCRQSGDSKYIAKLSLDELQGFSEQMNNLPCKIKEATLIQELLQKVLDFQQEAQENLDQERPNTDTLCKLVDFGVTLDVELPEIPKLKQLLNQAMWLDKVQVCLDGKDVSLDLMRKLIEQGVGLVPHPACEKAMAEIQELLTQSERIEEKARVCLQARPRHAMPSLETIVTDAEKIPAFLPNVSQLTEAIRKAKEWISKVDIIQNGEHYPYLDVLEALVNKGRPITVRLDQLPQLESQVAAAKSWRERTARTFLKKNSTYSLVEVLSPRSDIGIYMSSKNRRKKLKELEREKDPPAAPSNPENKSEDQQQDPATIVAQFKKSEIAEVESMRELRTKNIEKQHKTEPEIKYCVCRRGPAGFMLQCELCKDWFHSSCVPLPKSANMKGKSLAAQQAAKELKFLCPLCLRSRRPRLETILSLLVSLQKLPVRLPEGEALQCLTERAMAWQDKARQALATEELASALAKLSVFSQRILEAAAREKTEKIISAELMKAASNPELQSHVESVQQCAFGKQPAQPQPFSEEENGSGDRSTNPPVVLPEAQDSDDTQSDVEVEGSPSMGVEHTYSTASKIGPGVKKQMRKSAIFPRPEDVPFLKLSELAKAQLEELMMEGDLLEVSLDETQHIWRIIQACQTDGSKILQFEGEADPELTAPALQPDDKNNSEKKKKKRKEEELKVKDGMGGDKIKKKKLKLAHPNKPKDSPKDLEKKKKKKKKKDDLPPMAGGQQRLTDGGVMIIDEEDDVCSALKCLRPTGLEVSWVQCDKCEEWFHMICIGVSEEEISENEDYICFQCKNPRVSRPPGFMTPKQDDRIPIRGSNYPASSYPTPANSFQQQQRGTMLPASLEDDFSRSDNMEKSVGGGGMYTPGVISGIGRRSSDFVETIDDDDDEEEQDVEFEEEDYGRFSSNSDHLPQKINPSSAGDRQLDLVNRVKSAMCNSNNPAEGNLAANASLRQKIVDLTEESVLMEQEEEQPSRTQSPPIDSSSSSNISKSLQPSFTESQPVTEQTELYHQRESLLSGPTTVATTTSTSESSVLQHSNVAMTNEPVVMESP